MVALTLQRRPTKRTPEVVAKICSNERHDDITFADLRSAVFNLPKNDIREGVNLAFVKLLQNLTRKEMMPLWFEAFVDSA